MHYKFQRLTEPATLLKVTLLHGCFPRILNCTNGTKTRKTSHIIFRYLKRKNRARYKPINIQIKLPCNSKWLYFYTL